MMTESYHRNVTVSHCIPTKESFRSGPFVKTVSRHYSPSDLHPWIKHCISEVFDLTWHMAAADMQFLASNPCHMHLREVREQSPSLRWPRHKCGCVAASLPWIMQQSEGQQKKHTHTHKALCGPRATHQIDRSKATEEAISRLVPYGHLPFAVTS